MSTSINPVNILQRWSGASTTVVNAIKGAAAKTGVSFDYLMNKAKQESSFNPTAKAGTSSATGLFQFIDSTWLEAVKDYGSKFGLGDMAQQISTDSNGKPQVSDAVAKQKILDLRKDPTVAANITAAVTQDNASYLQNSIGGKIGETDLYLAHFLGLGGADKFLKARQADPTQAAADIFPAAADANKNVFYDASGRKKSVEQVYDFFASKMDSGTSSSPVTMVAAGDNKGVHLPSLIKPSGSGFMAPQDNSQTPTTATIAATASSIAQRQLLETMLSGIDNFGSMNSDGLIQKRAEGQLLSPYTSFILARLRIPGELAGNDQRA